ERRLNRETHAPQTVAQSRQNRVALAASFVPATIPSTAHSSHDRWQSTHARIASSTRNACIGISSLLLNGASRIQQGTSHGGVRPTMAWTAEACPNLGSIAVRPK